LGGPLVVSPHGAVVVGALDAGDAFAAACHTCTCKASLAGDVASRGGGAIRHWT